MTYAREGAHVIVVDVIDQLPTVGYKLATKDDLDETARLVAAHDRRVIALKADVRSQEQLDAAVAAGIAEFGKIDQDTDAPRVVASDQHVLNLLSKRAQVLHLAAANYCWFTDPSRALCLKMAGTPAADKPLAGMCDSARCPQATHHPCHRPVWADAVASTTAFIGSLGRTRMAERTRLQVELDRAQRVLDSIDAATAEEDGHADHR